MIKDIEEESKTKFSIKVEFSFSFKGGDDPLSCILRNLQVHDILLLIIFC